MSIKLFDNRGTPLEQQKFTWRELSIKPLSKLDDDAFTRVRVILMNGIEQQVKLPLRLRNRNPMSTWRKLTAMVYLKILITCIAILR